MDFLLNFNRIVYNDVLKGDIIMKKSVLEPTEENLLNTIKDDVLGRNEDLLAVYKLLNSIDESFSIALDAPWGEGKTFFLKQLQLLYRISTFDSVNDKKMINILKSVLKNNSPPPSTRCIYFDAWNHDYSKYPLQSLIFSICSQLDKDYKTEMLSNEDLISTVKKIGLCFEKRARNLSEIFESADEVKKYLEESDLSESIKTFFEQISDESANKLIIVIDELDRCNPCFAVELLEGIKHYFCNDKVIFVFGINSDQLQYTIKNYYGNEFDSLRYLDKFFDLHIHLTTHDISKYNSILETEHVYTNMFCKCICKHFKLSLRETCHLYEITKITTDNWFVDKYAYNFQSLEASGKAVMNYIIIPLVYTLKITNSTIYSKFVDGEDCTPLYTLIPEITHRGFFKKFFMDSTERQSVKLTNAFVEERLEKVYDAIFVDEYENHENTIVGVMEFNSTSKKYVLDEINYF